MEDMISDFKYTRIESRVPYTVRVVQYPNGKQVLQGGFHWSMGYMAGTDWRDLEVILVDDNGIELEKDSLL